MGAVPGARNTVFQTDATATGGSRRRADVWQRYGYQREYIRDVAALVLAYYAAAHLGYALSFSGPVAAIVWLPVGVGIAFLYLRGLRLWPGVFLGDLLVNNYSALPVGSALAQTAGNVAEVLLATILLQHLCRRRGPVTTIGGVAGMLAALACGTLLSATVGSLSSWLGGVISTHSLPYVWRTWWLGDLCGALIVVPFTLSWSVLPRPPWRPERVLEASVTMLAVAALSALAFAGGGSATGSLVFPPLIWAALRFGPRGATLAILITAGAAIWGTSHHIGQFAVGDIDTRLLETQLFIAVVSLSGLSITALVSERERLAENVQRSRARVVAASDETRRRLERDLHDGAQQRLVVLAARLAQAAEEAHRDHEHAGSMLEAAEADVQRAINELREFSRGVHPAVLRDLGLAKALVTVAGRSTIPIELRGLPTERLDDTSEATAYYIVLEAITNAQKYSRATAVMVRGSLRRSILSLEVLDEGVGGAQEHDGAGLQGLRDRVESLGGRFRVESRPGHGTRLAASFPVAVRR